MALKIPDSMQREDVMIPAFQDRWPLAATAFSPKNAPTQTSGKRLPPVVVLGAATGVKGAFYNAFAVWLAERGAPAVTFDFRLCGASFPESVDTKNKDQRDEALKAHPEVGHLMWGTRDLPAVLAYAAQRFGASRSGPRELVLCGNSLGGHLATFAQSVLPRDVRMARVLMLGCTSPYWGYAPDPKQYKMYTKGVIQSIHEEGYMNSKALGLGDNIPKEAGLNWLESSLQPHYLASQSVFVPYFSSYNTPTLSIAFSDDHLGHGGPRKADAFLRTCGSPNCVESAAEGEWWAAGARGEPPAVEPRTSWTRTRVFLDVTAQGWVHDAPPLPAGTDGRPKMIGHVDCFRAQVGAEPRSKAVWQLFWDFINEGVLPAGELLRGGGRRDFGPDGPVAVAETDAGAESEFALGREAKL